MKKIVRVIQAASTLSEANYLPKLFHVLIIFTKWIWFANYFKWFSHRNVWPLRQRAEIRERITSESSQKIRKNFM